MLRTLKSLQGVSVLSKEAQKKIAGSGSCGVIYTYHNSGSCLNQSGMTQSGAQNFVATYQEPPVGEAPIGVYWCCASCGNYEPCPQDF